MTIVKGKIGNALTSVAPDHVVAVAQDIYDEALSMYQSAINGKAVLKANDGSVAMGSKKITGLAAPTADQDAATKKYVDDIKAAIDTLLNGNATTAIDTLAEVVQFLSGVTNTETLTAKLAALQGTADGALPKSGGIMTGNLDMNGHQIQRVGNPVSGPDAANKTYVDGKVVSSWTNATKNSVAPSAAKVETMLGDYVEKTSMLNDMSVLSYSDGMVSGPEAEQVPTVHAVLKHTKDFIKLSDVKSTVITSGFGKDDPVNSKAVKDYVEDQCYVKFSNIVTTIPTSGISTSVLARPASVGAVKGYVDNLMDAIQGTTVVRIMGMTYNGDMQGSGDYAGFDVSYNGKTPVGGVLKLAAATPYVVVACPSMNLLKPKAVMAGGVPLVTTTTTMAINSMQYTVLRSEVAYTNGAELVITVI